MTDSERDASAKPQGQSPPPGVVEMPAARLASLAASRRVLQADQLHARQLDAWAQAERDDTLDQVFGGPVSLDAVIPYLHRLAGGEIESAIVIAGHVARFLREEGFADFVRVLLAEQVAGQACLSLRVSPEVHGRVATLAHAFRRLRATLPTLGERIGGRATLHWHGTWELTLRLSRLRSAALLTAAGEEPAPDMVPLLARRIGTVVFADRELLGSTLLIGEEADGTSDGLSALLASLLARRGPATRVWAIAGEGLAGGALQALPQWAAEPIDPDDWERVAALLEGLVAELARRQVATVVAEPAAREEIVLAIGEAADLSNDDDAPLLEALARDGPRHGIRVVAATAAPVALGEGALAAFGTWLLFRLPDPEDEDYIEVPRASELPRGAVLVPRLAGRQPSGHGQVGRDESRPVRIDPLELATLAQAMLLYRDLPAPVRAGAPGPGPIEVRCAGVFAARHGERALAARWNGRPNTKAWELLALLAVLPPGPIDRARLTAMLWPKPRRGAGGDDGDEAGRDNRLYQAMADLRKLLAGQASAEFAEALVAARGGRFRLDERLVSSQAHRFLALHRGAAALPLDEALAEYETGCQAWSLVEEGLLRDLDPPWLDEDYDGRGPPSRRYREQVLELTGALAARCLAEERAAEALPLARRLVAAEPTEEDAICLLLDCHRLLRDAGSAERAYQDHRVALRALYADPRAVGNRMVAEPGQRVRRLRATLLAELGYPLPDEPNR